MPLRAAIIECLGTAIVSGLPLSWRRLMGNELLKAELHDRLQRQLTRDIKTLIASFSLNPQTTQRAIDNIKSLHNHREANRFEVNISHYIMVMATRPEYKFLFTPFKFKLHKTVFLSDTDVVLKVFNTAREANIRLPRKAVREIHRKFDKLITSGDFISDRRYGTKGYTLRDVMFLLRLKPSTPELEQLYKQIANNTYANRT